MILQHKKEVHLVILTFNMHHYSYGTSKMLLSQKLRLTRYSAVRHTVTTWTKFLISTWQLNEDMFFNLITF